MNSGVNLMDSSIISFDSFANNPGDLGQPRNSTRQGGFGSPTSSQQANDDLMVDLEGMPSKQGKLKTLKFFKKFKYQISNYVFQTTLLAHSTVYGQSSITKSSST